ncbi:unnamed protein product [Bursaphelenchus okinawaensis]|uniref:AMP-binding domain-containing protein n=1 Tax=Bursaphelenchus okinawaensis TaxID=465554 RepID=A0A811K1G6_9BILA|nr:unnamed protein product [Bursaphelenchus okinawaensis]CAG9088884.1 unnamed protein product [Bursaphelenchus okinawaensis]
MAKDIIVPLGQRVLRVMEDIIEDDPDRVIMIYDEVEVNSKVPYDHVYQCTLSLLNFLQREHLLGYHNVIGICLENCHQFIVAFTAVTSVNSIAALFDPEASSNDLLNQVNSSKAETLITTAEVFLQLLEQSRHWTSLRNVILVNRFGKPMDIKGFNVFTWSQVISHKPSFNKDKVTFTVKTDPALLIYPEKPRRSHDGILISHAALITKQEATLQFINTCLQDCKPKDPNISYVNGFSNGTVSVEDTVTSENDQDLSVNGHDSSENGFDSHEHQQMVDDYINDKENSSDDEAYSNPSYEEYNEEGDDDYTVNDNEDYEEIPNTEFSTNCTTIVTENSTQSPNNAPKTTIISTPPHLIEGVIHVLNAVMSKDTILLCQNKGEVILNAVSKYRPVYLSITINCALEITKMKLESDEDEKNGDEEHEKKKKKKKEKEEQNKEKEEQKEENKEQKQKKEVEIEAQKAKNKEDKIKKENKEEQKNQKEEQGEQKEEKQQQQAQKAKKEEEYDLTSVKVLDISSHCVGRYVAQQLVEKFTEVDHFVQTVRIPEVLNYSCLSKGKALVGHCGQAMKGVRYKIIDPETDKEVIVGSVGELWLKSPTFLTEFWGNPEGKANVITHDGWYLTGKLATKDVHNNLIYVCDANEVIYVQSSPVYPTLLEEKLLSHPKVLDCAVVGVSHKKLGKVPRAFIVKLDLELTEEEVFDHIRENGSSEEELLGGVYFVSKIPRNASGGVDKQLLVKLFVLKK